MPATDILRPFTTLGAHFTSVNGKNASGSCPVCFTKSKRRGREGAFYVNQQTGAFQCHHCNAAGYGIEGISAAIHAKALLESNPSTKDEKDNPETNPYLSLAKLKPPIPWNIFQRERIAFSKQHGYWIIPQYDADNKVVEVRIFKPTPKAKIYTLAGGHQQLFRLNKLHQRGSIYICEGEWDAITLAYIFLRAGDETSSVVSVPGSYSSKWNPYFVNRNVVIVTDNDPAGDKHAQDATFKLQSTARNLLRIRWPSDIPCNDIRDLANERLRQADLPDFSKTAGQQLAASIVSELNTMTVEARTSTAGFLAASITEKDRQRRIAEKVPKNKPTFQVLCKMVDDMFHFKDLPDLLSVILGTAISAEFPGDPCWLFLVGEPGCGKSLLLQALHKSYRTHFESSISPKSLVSGYKTDDDVDPSIIPKINRKTLVTKDLTTLLTMPREERENVFGILRDAFDGLVTKTIANDIRREYKSKFNFIAGVTNRIHSERHSSFGERFIKYQMTPMGMQDPNEEEADIRRTLRGMADKIDNEALLQELLCMFLDQANLTTIPDIPPWFEDKIIPLVQVVCRLRAETYDGAYKPGAERGNRLCQQLTKLAQGISLVRGEKQMSRTVLPIIRKIAFDTCIGWQSDLMIYILRAAEKEVGKSKKRFSEWSGISTTEIDKGTGTLEYNRMMAHLKDLRELGLVEVSERFSKPGKRTVEENHYKPTQSMLDLWIKSV